MTDHEFQFAQVRRELRWLKGHALATTALLGALALAAFRRAPANAPHEKFGVIDVERINVVEPNGMYRMVISNAPESPGPIFKGKPFAYAGGGRPGLIFYNDEGTENGGLVFHGSRDANGHIDAGAHMSFDQFDNDQVLNLDYREEQDGRLVGISMLDRAGTGMEKIAAMNDSLNRIKDSSARRAEMMKILKPADGEPLAATRIFLGRGPAKASTLILSDPNGHARIRLRVDSTGAPSLDFLDAKGHVTSHFPEAGK